MYVHSCIYEAGAFVRYMYVVRMHRLLIGCLDFVILF